MFSIHQKERYERSFWDTGKDRLITLTGDRNDYGETVRITPLQIRHTCGFHIIRSPQGIFWRYDCYWYGSPYGWQRT